MKIVINLGLANQCILYLLSNMYINGTERNMQICPLRATLGTRNRTKSNTDYVNLTSCI